MTARRLSGASECCCPERLGELFDYLDDDLTEASCRRIEQHLDSCRGCGSLAANLQKAIAICRTEGRRQLPAAVRNRARARIRELLAQSRQPTAPRRQSPRTGRR